MTGPGKIVMLLVTLVLNASCANHNPAGGGSKQGVFFGKHVTDTLKFTKGIRSILQDSKGNYWFGSDQEGVCRYDGKTFTYYSTQTGFCGKQVLSIQEDETGIIWFGTSTGLCGFDGLRFFSDNRQTAFGSGVMHNTDLWFAGNSRDEIIRINKGYMHILKNPVEIPKDKNPVNYGITGFSTGKKGGLWIAYYSGVLYYDGKTTGYINDSTLHLDGKSRYMHVRSILEDSGGRLWIGNNGMGVLVKENDSVLHFSKIRNLVKGEMSGSESPPGTLMHVFAIMEDLKGNIWFGDRDTGAWRFDGKEMKNFVVDATLRSQHIWDIYEDKYGNLLFAMAERGIYLFNGKGFERVL